MPDTRDLPLFGWAAELRHARLARHRLRRRNALAAAGIALVGLTIVAPPAPHLVWNASASAPLGLYRVFPGTAFQRGDMVVARMPASARALAAHRHYLPAHVPLVKRVAAVPSDTVCAVGQAIFVNSGRVAERRARDGARRPMPWWTGCRTLHAGELFLLMADSSASFDGRYFGMTSNEDVIGKAVLLWRR